MADNCVVCPFNKSHVVTKLRLPYHITKCRKNYTNSNKIVCPYDASEYIEPHAYHDHLESCTMKKTFDVYRAAVMINNLNGHGDCTPRTYEVDPSLVTDDWNKEDATADAYQTAKDEFNVAEQINRTSMLIKKACSYIPQVKSLGRGQKLLDNYLSQTMTNGSRSNHLKMNGSSPYNKAKLLSSDSDNGAYDDAEETHDVEVESEFTSSENDIPNKKDDEDSVKTDHFRTNMNDSAIATSIQTVCGNVSLQDSCKLIKTEDVPFDTQVTHSGSKDVRVISSTSDNNTSEQINVNQNTHLEQLPIESNSCVQKSPRSTRCLNKDNCKQENNPISSTDTSEDESVSEATSIFNRFCDSISFRSQTVNNTLITVNNIPTYKLVDTLVNDFVSKNNI